MSMQAYEQYRQMRVQTAGPGQLVLMLYDAGLKQLDAAEAAIGENKPLNAHQALVKAQDIVLELAMGLDHEKGGELARNLGTLYDFMYRQLVQANVSKDADAVRQVRDLLAGLQESWQQALSGSNGNGNQGGLGRDLRA